MNKNVGTADRILRILLGAVLIGLAATGTIGLWGYIGIVALATGLISWCPAYAVLGFNSGAKKSD